MRIASDAAALAEARAAAKLVRCPHCSSLGTLNAHGYLRGYAEQLPHTQVTRGGRFFCSNRHNRPGCGRTFSVLLSCFLSGFVLLAQTLFVFVVAVAQGLPKARAWQSATKSSFSRASGYRMWRKITHAQASLRTLLLSCCGPPPSPSSKPLVQWRSPTLQIRSPLCRPTFSTIF
jgi:hypothetical protein